MESNTPNDRIHRLARPFMHNDELLDSPQCSICCLHSSSINESNKVCDFCWYDFNAKEDERQQLCDLDSFRDRSVRIWYKHLGVDKTQQCYLSPLTIMYILHDCFRSSNRLSMEYTLKMASNNFPESVSWLKRLLAGSVPVVSLVENERVYKFAAGIGRTPIWYKVDSRLPDNAEGRSFWKWTPSYPNGWIECPQLEVSYEPWTGQVPREENIFIILFLHTFGPSPPYSDSPLTQAYITNEERFTKISQYLPTAFSPASSQAQPEK